MNIYGVGRTEDEVFFGGKTEACKSARDIACSTGEQIEVTEYTLIPGKAGVVALANRGSPEPWRTADQVVYTAQPRKQQRAKKSEKDPWE